MSKKKKIIVVEVKEKIKGVFIQIVKKVKK